QLHIKNKRGVWWNNPTGPTRTIAQVAWNHKTGLIANLQQLDAFVRTFNHVAHSQRKNDGLSSFIGRIKFGSISQGTFVMYGNGFSFFRFFTVPLLDYFV